MRIGTAIGIVMALGCSDPNEAMPPTGGGIGPAMPTCSFTEAVEQVDATQVDNLDAMLAYLAGTDGGLSAAAGEVELVCASDGKLGRLWPDEGLPDGTCEGSVAFDVPVDLAAERVPAGQTGPFVAGVSVAGWWGGEIMATIPSGSPTGADDSQTGMAGVPAPILQTEPPT